MNIDTFSPSDDTPSHRLRRLVFELSTRLADTSPQRAADTATAFFQLSPLLTTALENASNHLEPVLREYDPVLANRLEDGSLRLSALLTKLTPRFQRLTELTGASFDAERYSLYLDWNLLVAECLVQLDFHVRLAALMPRPDTLPGTSNPPGRYPGLLARSRDRVREYCACQ